MRYLGSVIDIHIGDFVLIALAGKEGQVYVVSEVDKENNSVQLKHRKTGVIESSLYKSHNLRLV